MSACAKNSKNSTCKKDLRAILYSRANLTATNIYKLKLYTQR